MCILQINVDILSIKNMVNIMYFMCYIINFFDFCKYICILNLMPATRFKQVGTGEQKTEKVVECPKAPE